MADKTLEDIFKEIDTNPEFKREKIQPKNNGLVTDPDEQDHNFWQTVADMSMSVPQGIVNSIEAQGDFLEKHVIGLGGLKFGDGDGEFEWSDLKPEYISPKEWKEGGYIEKKTMPDFHKPETQAGQFTEAVSRFITGMYGPSKFLKGVGVGGTLVKSGVRGMTAGAVADLTVLDPNEGNLSNMLTEFNSPVLNNAVTRYLAIDEDDTEMEGRLKNVLEGMLIGGPLEILIGIKGMKKARKVKDLKQKEEIIADHGKAIKDLVDGKGKTLRVRKKLVEGNKAINVNKVEKAVKIGQKTAQEDAERFIKRILNTSKLKSARHVLKTIDDVLETLDDNAKEYLQNNVLKNKVAKELAEILARDTDEILKAMPKAAEAAKQSTVRMLASKMVLQQLGFQHKALSNKIIKKFGADRAKAYKEGGADLAELNRLSNLIKDTTFYLKEQIRGAARTTQAGRIKVGKSGKTINVNELSDTVTQYNGDAFAIATKVSQNETIEQVYNTLGKTRMQKSVEIFNSLYINSLLSGIFTNAINLTSGLHETVIRPLEIMAGGLARADKRSIRLGFAQYQGMLLNMKESFRMVYLSLKQGDAVLDTKMKTQDNLTVRNGKAIRPISAENLELEGLPGTVVDWIGVFLEFPSRLLIGGDELLKQLNYRGRLYANALDDTMTRNIDIKSKEGKENITKIMNKGFDEKGAANVKDKEFGVINQKALDDARISNFTNEIKGGSYRDWASNIESFFNQAPEFRFIAPFIRTPTNIWRHFGTRIPGLGLFTKQMRDMWNSGDPRLRAEVIGRQFFGTSAAFIAFDYVTSYEAVEIKDAKGNVIETVRLPKITGKGPSDPNIQRIWRMTGWQPYSILVKDDNGKFYYKAYNRMDPRFFIYGLAADLKEGVTNMNEEEKFALWSAIPLTVMRNLTDKSYTQGIAEVMEFMNEPTQQNFRKFFGNVAGNVIPYTGLRNQGIPFMLDQPKDVFDTRSFYDQILSKTPFTGSLEKKRDIFGKEVEKNETAFFLNPDGYSGIIQGPALFGKVSEFVDNNKVLLELAALKVALSPPTQMKGKVDLAEFELNGQSALDYWREQIGVVTVNGLTIEKYFERKMKSSQWRRMQETQIVDGKKRQGGKEYLAQQWYDAFKQKAYAEMLKKYPEVKKAIIQDEKDKYQFFKPDNTKSSGTRLDKEQDTLQRILLY